MAFKCDYCELPIITPYLYERPHTKTPTVTYQFCSPVCRDRWIHEVTQPVPDEDDA